MKLIDDIEDLKTLQATIDHPIGRYRIAKLIEKLEYIKTLTDLFDKEVSRAYFHVKRIHNIPWLFFRDKELMLLTEKQAENINKIIKSR